MHVTINGPFSPSPDSVSQTITATATSTASNILRESTPGPSTYKRQFGSSVVPSANGVQPQNFDSEMTPTSLRTPATSHIISPPPAPQLSRIFPTGATVRNSGALDGRQSPSPPFPLHSLLALIDVDEPGHNVNNLAVMTKLSQAAVHNVSHILQHNLDELAQILDSKDHAVVLYKYANLVSGNSPLASPHASGSLSSTSSSTASSTQPHLDSGTPATPCSPLFPDLRRMRTRRPAPLTRTPSVYPIDPLDPFCTEFAEVEGEDDDASTWASEMDEDELEFDIDL